MGTKIILSVLIIMVACLQAQGQVTTRSLKARAPEAAPALPPYDSLHFRFTTTNYRQYIGQDIYVLPESKLYTGGRRGDDYYGFTPALKHNYNLHYNYRALAGKYFKIVDIINQLDPGVFGISNKGLYLKLRGAESGDSLYFMVGEDEADVDFRTEEYPFVIVGVFEKVKRLETGSRKRALKNATGYLDINSSKPVVCLKGSTWTVVDVTLADWPERCYLWFTYIMKDSLGDEIAAPPSAFCVTADCDDDRDFKSVRRINEEQAQRDSAANKEKDWEAREDSANLKSMQDQVRAQEKANGDDDERQQDAAPAPPRASHAPVASSDPRTQDLIDKFGPHYGPIIAKGNIEKGMTEKMCVTAWGKPDDTKKTVTDIIVFEQWTYHLTTILHFENGILTRIDK